MLAPKAQLHRGQSDACLRASPTAIEEELASGLANLVHPGLQRGVPGQAKQVTKVESGSGALQDDD